MRRHTAEEERLGGKRGGRGEPAGGPVYVTHAVARDQAEAAEERGLRAGALLHASEAPPPNPPTSSSSWRSELVQRVHRRRRGNTDTETRVCTCRPKHTLLRNAACSPFSLGCAFRTLFWFSMGNNNSPAPTSTPPMTLRPPKSKPLPAECL